jgi:hypothetical protein
MLPELSEEEKVRFMRRLLSKIPEMSFQMMKSMEILNTPGTITSRHNALKN